MSSEMYTLIALAARYWFAGLMLLIVFRAWRVTVVDNRRARILREWTPETGCVGEMLINPGGKRRLRVPIPQEGVLGSSRKADIRIKYAGVLPMHAHIEQRRGGLLVRPLGKATVALGEGAFTGDTLFARDGDVLLIGKLRLLVVLFEPDAQEEDAGDEEDAAFFPDEKARDLPAPGEDAQEDAGEDYDEFFDEDALWGKDRK